MRFVSSDNSAQGLNSRSCVRTNCSGSANRFLGRNEPAAGYWPPVLISISEVRSASLLNELSQYGVHDNVCTAARL